MATGFCPKQNQTDVENSPAAKEVLPRIRKSGRNKGLSDLGCYLPTDVARGISHVVSLRIRDHKIANTQKKGEGRARGQTQKGRMGQGARSEMRAHG